MGYGDFSLLADGVKWGWICRGELRNIFTIEF